MNSRTFRRVIIWLAVALSGNAIAAAVEEHVHFDFESGDLQAWQVVEGRFDDLVSDRSRFHNTYPDREFDNNTYNKQGKYHLSTVEQQPGQPSNDAMTGVAESPVFVLSGPSMSMLVGSGTQQHTYIALCTLDGQEVLLARGKPMTEVMQRVEWNAPQLVGQRVFLRVVDREHGGWGHVTFDDFSAEGTIDQEATRQRFAEIDLRRVGREVREEANCLPALRSAVADLAGRYAQRYPRGEEFLDQLARIEEVLQRDLDEIQPELLSALLQELKSLRREALVAHPLLVEQPIVFVVRHQYSSHYHAIDTLFSTDEFNADRNQQHVDLFEGGGALKVIDLATGEVRTVLQLPEGVVRDPDVHFDGQRIVFAMRRGKEEDYHIWEIQADGSGLKQLTSATCVADFDPIYLPDDSIVFSSTREPKYNQCSRDIGANLFRMEPDGANIHQMGKNNLFDNHAALMPDGRILYARWEYVDRNFGDAHSLWTVNPDGTNQALWWGNNTASPGAAFNPHVIPGTERVLCIFGPHHDRLWGALAIVDRRLGIEGRPGVIRTWPAQWIDRVRTGGAFDCDEFARVSLKYADPWPLDEHNFLVSRMISPGESMGIFLVDLWGNEVLLHAEAPGCFDPMPLGPRPRPPVIPTHRDFENGEGVFYVSDVYQGTHMEGITRGSVKQLRIVEAPEKRHWARGAWFGQGYTAPGMNWHSLECKRILGTVPVEADGSASFILPAETFVYFQLLDENGMMVQSMRSGTSVQSGERIGCVGCHEQRRCAPPSATAMPLALLRPPSRPESWYGPRRTFSFMAEVQPVLDRHCTTCHDYGKDAGKKLNLAADRDITFNTAYNELWRKGYITCVGAGPAEIQPARSWGSHASPLVAEIRQPKVAEHRDIRLSAEDLERIVTWIDLNGVYYPTYASAYPDSLTGRCPLDDAQLQRLAQLTLVPFDQLRSFAADRGPQITFERPQWSPCLANVGDVNSADYREALSIIQSGKARLAERPRADMPGFQPSGEDLRREAKFALRRQIELRSRAAIRQGTKYYDQGD